MKVNKNAEHNSIEIDFEGAKPSEEVRKLMKAYGFWWFQKNKVWVHSLECDGEFFESFVEERIRPLVEKSMDINNLNINMLSEEQKQALLAQLMGK